MKICTAGFLSLGDTEGETGRSSIRKALVGHQCIQLGFSGCGSPYLPSAALSAPSQLGLGCALRLGPFSGQAGRGSRGGGQAARVRAPAASEEPPVDPAASSPVNDYPPRRAHQETRAVRERSRPDGGGRRGSLAESCRGRR